MCDMYIYIVYYVILNYTVIVLYFMSFYISHHVYRHTYVNSVKFLTRAGSPWPPWLRHPQISRSHPASIRCVSGLPTAPEALQLRSVDGEAPHKSSCKSKPYDEDQKINGSK